MRSTAICHISQSCHHICTHSRHWVRTALILLAACSLVLLATAPALADGFVVDARSGSGAGPQIDAVLVSPAPRTAPPGARTPPVYTVRPGDSLSAIAAEYSVDPEALVRLNNLADPDTLVPGQALVLPRQESSALSLPDGGPIERLQFWPWPPLQGQTVAMWLQARSAVTVAVTFGGRTDVRALHGGRGEFLLPVNVLAEPGSSLLELRTSEGTVRLRLPVEDAGFPTYHIPQETGGGILDEAARVRAETQRMTELFGLTGPQFWPARARFRLPFEGSLVETAPFGQRRTYGNSPAISAHAGQDYSAAPGTPVYAPAAGTVVLAEPLFVRGNAVVLDHGGGVYTGYWHLSEISVQGGRQVAAGELIGKVGSTGLSTGAHLHWEMRVAGVAVDPEQWVSRQEAGEGKVLPEK
jgi:murein DD-endopeptidase MepM/ murein hydrolase activator NlpD